ncbi:MAG: transposase [Terriglobia bacterium]
MESIKARSTLPINASGGERGLLWQPRFFDRALRTVKEYYEKVEYIHLNPVRAGLVKRAEEWQWSSAHDYTGRLSATFRPNRTLAIHRVPLPAYERGRIWRKSRRLSEKRGSALTIIATEGRWPGFSPWCHLNQWMADSFLTAAIKPP